MSPCPSCGEAPPAHRDGCPMGGTISAPGNAPIPSDLARSPTLHASSNAARVPLTRQSEEEDLPPGSQIGEYKVEGKLGEGGMGCVFAAVHPVIDKRAAIKVLKRELCADASLIDRFITEARAVN